MILTGSESFNYIIGAQIFNQLPTFEQHHKLQTFQLKTEHGCKASSSRAFPQIKCIISSQKNKP